jgi:hypothetical protein
MGYSWIAMKVFTTHDRCIELVTKIVYDWSQTVGGGSNIDGIHNPQNFRSLPPIPFETLTGEFSKGQKGNLWDHLQNGRVGDVF